MRDRLVVLRPCAIAGMVAVIVSSPAMAQGSVDAAVTRLLNSATQSLTDNQVVSAACKSEDAIRRLAGLVQQAQQITGKLQKISSGIRFTGLPTTDLGEAIAGQTYGKAAELGAEADQYAATFGLAAVCNTQQTADAVRARFDFLRTVVNRGIEQRLPSLDAALAMATSAGQPDPDAAERAATYQRIFNVNTAVGSDNALQVVDAELQSALALADRADAAAQANRTTLDRLADRLVSRPSVAPDGSLACSTVDSSGTLQWNAPAEDGTCGPLSPGAAPMVTAATEIAAANDQQTLALIEAAKSRVAALQARKDIRRDFLDRVVDVSIVK